jgi:hypothetical protein
MFHEYGRIRETASRDPQQFTASGDRRDDEAGVNRFSAQTSVFYRPAPEWPRTASARTQVREQQLAQYLNN